MAKKTHPYDLGRMAAEVIRAHRDALENDSTNSLAADWKVPQKTLDEFTKKPTNARLSTLSSFVNAWGIDPATFFAMHPTISAKLADGETNPTVARLERTLSGPTLDRVVEACELANELGILDHLARGLLVFLNRLKSAK